MKLQAGPRDTCNAVVSPRRHGHVTNDRHFGCQQRDDRRRRRRTQSSDTVARELDSAPRRSPTRRRTAPRFGQGPAGFRRGGGTITLRIAKRSRRLSCDRRRRESRVTRQFSLTLQRRHRRLLTGANVGQGHSDHDPDNETSAGGRHWRRVDRGRRRRRKLATFTVTLSAKSHEAISISATADGTATGSDYKRGPDRGFAETSKTISITINGDTADEAEETFSVNLLNPTMRDCGRTGRGTISTTTSR